MKPAIAKITAQSLGQVLNQVQVNSGLMPPIVMTKELLIEYCVKVKGITPDEAEMYVDFLTLSDTLEVYVGTVEGK